MAGRLYIPSEVKASIAEHIAKSVEKSRLGYLSGNEDEDTLTGDLGACLRIPNQSVNVLQGEIRGTWKWSMTYYKFRGRGAGATEAIIGADGVFEITLDDSYRPQTKSLLFQDKKEWDVDDKLFSQAMLLSTWREAAIVINYKPEAFEAFDLDNVIGARGRRKSASEPQALEALLGGPFLDCKVGDVELSYDAKTRKLSWRDMTGNLVETSFALKHRIGLKIIPPAPAKHHRKAEQIEPSQVHEHRMNVSPEEMFAIGYKPSKNDIKNRYKKLAVAYHSDIVQSIDASLFQAANRRMQEINQARDELIAKTRSKHGS